MNQQHSAHNSKSLHTMPLLAGQLLQRKCACGQHTPGGGQCPACVDRAKLKQPLQAKLQIGAANDRYEQEADRVADEVIHIPQPVSSNLNGHFQTKPSVQRHTATSSEGGTDAPSIVHDVLRSPGQPLEPAARAYMEPRFGSEFSHIRVHTNTEAAESASAVNAIAYTVGSDIVFGAGAYASNSEAGRYLLAHELTHTIQQAAGVMRLQRLVSCDRENCPPRDTPDEERRARDNPMIVHRDPGILLVANFDIDKSELKPGLSAHPFWKSFVADISSDPSRHWEVRGFSDCHGPDQINRSVRTNRAWALYFALPPAAQTQVDDVPLGADLDECWAANTKMGRPLNRSALIRLAKVDIPDEEIEGDRPIEKKIPECEEPGAVCVKRLTGPTEGLVCGGNFAADLDGNSNENLLDEVARGEAELICDSR